MKLFLKGTKCVTPKCPFERRGYVPGQHGQRRIRLSDYGVQLREKQKVRRMYGLLERSFRVTFQKAQRVKGVTGEKLLELLERRLDNVVYRLGWATSRNEARQIVHHRHIVVNQRIVDVPSFTVRVGDTIEAKANDHVRTRLQRNCDATKDRERTNWIEVTEGTFKGRIVRLPTKADVTLPVQEQLIVELYSR